MIGYRDGGCAVSGSSVFGRSSFQPVLDNVQCTGAERALEMCSFTRTQSSCRYNYYYYYNYDAGVMCINSKLLAFRCTFNYCIL